jgi:uncharacterized protein YdeI (YjbR/CyaY-like superfamily)
MAAPGLQAISVAKKNGKWTAMDSIEKLIYPPELESAFIKSKKAKKNFEKFSPSYKRLALAWIAGAKRAETKLKRVNAVVVAASKNEKFNA